MSNNKKVRKDSKVGIHTHISLSTKKRWERFLISRHGTIRGTFGPELEAAMNQYINSYINEFIDTNSAPLKTDKKLSDTLTLISTLLKTKRTSPLFGPVDIKATIEKAIPFTQRKQIGEYEKIVYLHSKDIKDPDEPFPMFDVTGFYYHAHRLENDFHSLK